ncbi:MAG: hypothetical protein WCV50_02570 [Patescibacteria group bacterium]|jgi:hypothetical protein
MVQVINLFLPLLLQILILYFLSQAVDRLVLRRLGRGWYLATMWPGVMIHELSHLVGCLLTFTRVYKVQLFYPQGGTLGMVQHEQTRNPLKSIIISIAPLFGATAVIWLLTRFLLPDFYFSNLDGLKKILSDFSSYQNFFSFTWDYFRQYIINVQDLIKQFNFSSWQTYLFIYLMLSLSSHAAPSKEDLKHTYFGLIGLAVIFFLIYLIDQWLAAHITWAIIQWLTYPVLLTAIFLSYGIMFAAISLAIMGIISVIVGVFSHIIR